MVFKHYNILSLNVQDWRCEFSFFILHRFISANLCAQLCPTYFFRLVHWTLFVFSNAPLGLVKSSSLNTLFYTSCLSANKKKLFRQIARAEFTLPSMHTNKRWEGDVEWESGFSFFFLNLSFFFSSHLMLHLRPRVSLTMKWPALKCAPLLCCHLAVWLSL